MLKMNTNALITPIAIALISGSALVGCSEQNGSGAAPQSSADDHGHDHGDGDHDHDHGTSDRTPDSYSGIKGEITQLPDASVPGSALKIHHEQIPDFKTVDGTINVTANGIAGMRSMTMPFPLGEGISIDGYSVGDKVAFDFVVNWGNDRPAWEITSIEKLPADTVIDYANATQEGFDEGAQDMMDHDHDHDHDLDHSHDAP